MIAHFTRPPAVAGTFYENDAARLRAQLDECCRRIDISDVAVRELKAAVLPHAGYVFSLPVALQTLIGGRKFRPELVVVFGPSHHRAFRGAALSGATAWRTPLGEMPLWREELPDSPLMAVDDAAHYPEHSIEVLLPLLQYFWGNVTILPVLVGGVSLADVHELAQVFSVLIRPGTLVLVSSDFTHYGRSFDYTPEGEAATPELLRRIDLPAAELIAGRDLNGFVSCLGRTGATICGMNPIALLLAMLDAAGSDARGRVVAQRDSGLVSGDYTHVVDYVGIAFD